MASEDGDYERGFAVGFERGFTVARDGLSVPVHVPTVIDCGCPYWGPCPDNTGCPRQQTGSSSSTTFKLPPGAVVSYGMSENGCG